MVALESRPAMALLTLQNGCFFSVTAACLGGQLLVHAACFTQVSRRVVLAIQCGLASQVAAQKVSSSKGGGNPDPASPSEHAAENAPAHNIKSSVDRVFRFMTKGRGVLGKRRLEAHSF